VRDLNKRQWTLGTGHNVDSVLLADEFSTHLDSHELRTLSYLNPSCCDVGTVSMHPSGLISDGEAYLKSIYEALRASSYWDETLIIITFVCVRTFTLFEVVVR
jgi:phospholipase C